MIVTITNYSKRTIVLKRKARFCTMILFKNESPATKECEKHPDSHITNLIDEWKGLERRPKKVIYFWILKILIPLIPLIWLLYNYLSGEVSPTEVALFVAISSFTFVILDKILRTE